MAKRVWYAYDEVEDPVSGALHHLTVTHEIDPADPPAWMVSEVMERLNDTALGDGQFPLWPLAREILIAALSANEVRDSPDARQEQRR